SPARARRIGRSRAPRPSAPDGPAGARASAHPRHPPRSPPPLRRYSRRQRRHMSAEKPRLAIVLAPFAALPAAEFVAVAREAEARGYHMAWTGEAGGYDAIARIAQVAWR